jgi:Ca2+-binding RTX toxin-like protein
MRRVGAIVGLAVLAAAVGPAARAPAGAGAICDGQPATIVAERYTVRGTPGDDVIVDPDGAGLIESGAGDDTICVAEADFHEVYAGRGDDRVHGARGQDYVYPGAGDDVARGRGGADVITDEDRGDDRLHGGAGRDDLRFSVPFERLKVDPVRVDLARGIARGHGRDRLSGFERVEGSGKPDALRGGRGPDVLDGIRGGDLIDGRGGDDLIFGARLLVSEAGPIDPYDGGDRALRGGSGDDRIFAGAGVDRLSGGPGDDLLDGGGPASRPGDGGDGGPGRDRCRDLESARGCERATG